MINNLLEKGLLIVLLMLFIGGSSIPSTLGVDKPSMTIFTDPTIVSIQPSSQIVEKGETCNVSIYITPGELIRGVSFNYLYFDPTLIQVINRTFDGLFAPYPTYRCRHFDFDNSNGWVRMIYEYLILHGGINTPGSWITLEFNVQQRSGTSHLNLSDAIIYDINYGHTNIEVYNGSISILGTDEPQISNFQLTTTEPLDTDPDFGWENFSCTVTDDGTLDVVQINFTYTHIGNPWKEYTGYFNVPMSNVGDMYFYNTTLSAYICGATIYEYHIWVKDTYGYQNATSPEEFFKPSNKDVNMDGRVQFMDAVAISLRYNAVGPPGWIREDVNNDGIVNSQDFDALYPCYYYP